MGLDMANKREKIVLASLILLGLGVWLGICLATGKREAWDAGMTFVLSLPVLYLASGFAGYAAPRKPWRWGLAAFAAQPVLLMIQNPSAGLLPIGLILFGILSVPGILCAYIGARLSPHRKSNKE